VSLLRVMIATFSLCSASAYAVSSPLSLPNISCGDHWFEIKVEVKMAAVTLTISGDSVHGEIPVYSPEVSITRDDPAGIDTYKFSFGDSPESAQTLVTTFLAGGSSGKGIYSLVEHDFQSNLNCSLKEQ